MLTRDECTALIDRVESVGFEPAPVSMLRGPVMRPEIRSNHRAVIDDVALADLLFERVRPDVPTQLSDMKVLGANERLRCYRYDPGQRFAPHYDGAYVRSPEEFSLLTFMIYLNDDFTGGETHFLHLEETVIPRPGLGLLFQHRLLHEGCPVQSGRKYAVRSDILYRSAPPAMRPC